MGETAIHVGVDGCRKGWVAVSRRGRSGEPETGIYPNFADLCAAFCEAAIIVVDIPIGLPDRIGPGGRGPEAAIRPHLGKRRSSVFSVPSRLAIYAEAGCFADEVARYAAHRNANLIARETSDPPRGLSIQTFSLFEKIRDVDCTLRADPSLAARVFESHPELAFAKLNGWRAMNEPKKRKGRINQTGMVERRALLAAYGIPATFLARPVPRGAGDDDLIDATALMLVAENIAEGSARPFPEPFPRDAWGLPIAIWV